VLEVGALKRGSRYRDGSIVDYINISRAAEKALRLWPLCGYSGELTQTKANGIARVFVVLTNFLMILAVSVIALMRGVATQLMPGPLTVLASELILLLKFDDFQR